MIVGELGMGDLFRPGGGVGAAEDVEVGFYFLVDSFGFSVGLGMVGGGEREDVV